MGICKIASAPKVNKIELKTGWLKLKELIGILKPVIMTPKQIALLDCACKWQVSIRALSKLRIRLSVAVKRQLR